MVDVIDEFDNLQMHERVCLFVFLLPLQAFEIVLCLSNDTKSS